MLLAALLLSACSSVPDAVNPVEWYRGVADWVGGDDDAAAGAAPAGYPKLSTVPDPPRTTSPEQRRALAEGLVSDRENARYSDETVNREGKPTSPLGPAPAPRATPEPTPEPPAAPAPQTAVPGPAPQTALPPTPPTPVTPAERVAAAEPPAELSPMSGTGMADAPPAEMAPAPISPLASPPVAAPPPPAPPAVPVGDLTEQSYQQRLAESGSATLAPPPQTTRAPLSQMAQLPDQVAGGTEGAPQLVPPAGAVVPKAPQGRADGVRPLSDYDAAATGASFQLASVLFPEGSAELSAENRRLLQDVVELQKRQGGTVRIVGHASAATMLAGDPVERMMASFDLAMRRANAVAQALTRMGVPARRMFVGAATDSEAGLPGVPGARGTEIFIDY